MVSVAELIDDIMAVPTLGISHVGKPPEELTDLIAEAKFGSAVHNQLYGSPIALYDIPGLLEFKHKMAPVLELSKVMGLNLADQGATDPNKPLPDKYAPLVKALADNAPATKNITRLLKDPDYAALIKTAMGNPQATAALTPEQVTQTVDAFSDTKSVDEFKSLLSDKPNGASYSIKDILLALNKTPNRKIAELDPKMVKDMPCHIGTFMKIAQNGTFNKLAEANPKLKDMAQTGHKLLAALGFEPDADAARTPTTQAPAGPAPSSAQTQAPAPAQAPQTLSQILFTLVASLISAIFNGKDMGSALATSLSSVMSQQGPART